MSSAPPVVSVLIPAYNAELTIGAAIAGALTQTYEHVEVVVVDDGSTDRTRSICEAYGDLITFVSIDNSGTAHARNVAAAHARGQFFALCDSDDILLPAHVASLLDAYRAAGSGRRFVHADAYFLTPTGMNHLRTVMYGRTPSGPEQRIRLLEANFVSIFTLFPASMFTELGGFTTSLYLEDWDLWLRAVFGGWEVVGSHRPQALYRQVVATKSSARSRVFEGEIEVLRRIAERPDLRPPERDYLRRRLASASPRALHDGAEAALRAGDFAGARRQFTQAAQLWRGNRALQVKARLMRCPLVPALWRRRVGSVDAELGRVPR